MLGLISSCVDESSDSSSNGDGKWPVSGSFLKDTNDLFGANISFGDYFSFHQKENVMYVYYTHVSTSGKTIKVKCDSHSDQSTPNAEVGKEYTLCTDYTVSNEGKSIKLSDGNIPGMPQGVTWSRPN